LLWCASFIMPNNLAAAAQPAKGPRILLTGHCE
jgi:hypothetical protein